MAVTVDGIPIHVRERGAGRPLVVLHPGPGLDGAVVMPWFGRLSGDFRVIVPDLPCSGRSGGGDPAAWTVERQAEIVAGLLGALGLGDAIVAGHSYGCFVALTLAVRRPDLLAGVVASCGAASEEVFDGIDERVDLEAEAALARARTPAECTAGWRGLIPSYFADPAGEGAAAFAAALGDVAWRPETVHTDVEEAYDLRGELADSRLPLLALGGAEDRCTPPAYTEEIASLAPRGEAVIVARAGHFPYAERPEAYFAALEAWLR